MEGKRAKVKSENDFDIKSLIVESSEARKILALNTREEKRLEKEREILEKQRAAEEKRLLKARKDVIIHFFNSRKRITAVKAGVHEKLPVSIFPQPWMFSSKRLLPLLSRTEKSKWEPQNVTSQIKNSPEGKENHYRNTSSGYSLTSCNSISILPDMQRILENERNLVQRSQSWSSESRTRYFRFLSEVASDMASEKQPPHSTEETLYLDNSTRGNGSETKRKETCLCDILPPFVLPPLMYSQKHETLGGRERVRRPNFKKWDHVKNEVWEDLEHCRYIRSYLKNK